MLASAFLAEGKCVTSFPMYGFERRGAPVMAFARIDDKPIREKNQVYTPDCMVVIDPTLLKVPTLFAGIKEEGVLILNSPGGLEQPPDKNVRIAGIVNATQIALDEMGRDIPNTCLLGALAATTNWIKLESINIAIAEYFDGSKLQTNVRSAERGYREVKVVKWH
jgi:2-oxoacid:acceptor oxidoreductase gamma subunit (pyruvate/2-ketoisovalerate family)